MNIPLHSEALTLELTAKGAEWQSIKSNAGREFLWSGDAAFWARKAPVLFPIVGRLKNHTYRWKEREYGMSQHGFARDLDFELLHKSESTAVFQLKADSKTKESYPFDFEFRISHSVEGNKVVTRYEIKNVGGELMPFSVGGHPAFALNLPIERYHLRFHAKERGLQRTELKEGLRSHKVPFLLKDDCHLPLSQELFEKDALVFETLASKAITLVEGSANLLTMRFEGFPFFGIWTKPNAPFLCLEPWAGIADSIEADGDLLHKQGITTIQPNEQVSYQFEVEFFT